MIRWQMPYTLAPENICRNAQLDMHGNRDTKSHTNTSTKKRINGYAKTVKWGNLVDFVAQDSVASSTHTYTDTHLEFLYIPHPDNVRKVHCL